MLIVHWTLILEAWAQSNFSGEERTKEVQDTTEPRLPRTLWKRGRGGWRSEQCQRWGSEDHTACLEEDEGDRPRQHTTDQ